MDTQRQAELDGFLAGVERRALRMAEFAVGNRDDALDIVQDSMLRLVQKYSRRPEPEWAPLFHRILQSRIRDCLRRRRSRRRWFGLWEDLADAPATPFEAPDPTAAEPPHQLANRDALQAVEQALTGLPERQRQAFLLRVWEGLDVKSTAYAMRCSEGSVKTHLARAMHQLRQILEAHLP